MGNPYNPEAELAKGARFEAASYDKTQKVRVIDAKVTVGGRPGTAEFDGAATGRLDGGVEGTVSLWLSIFRFMRPDGTVDHVAGWNITVPLKAGQTPAATARAFAKEINAAATRPYKAVAAGKQLMVVYSEK